MTSLSVVIPVYNEPEWIGRTIADAERALARAPFAPVEFVVVDDGSDPPTVAALNALATTTPLRVLRQSNQGRFAARRAGVRAATGDLVLLLDARVAVAPDALRFVADRTVTGGELPVWNAHVHIDVNGNPYARFWNVLTEIAFDAYFANPRTTSFGLDDFDRFPKGTTCFLAPRERLLTAIEQFDSAFEDLRDANDDTILIRSLAVTQPINISPGFACLYRSRDALRPFLRHAFHRGGVFVDGYGRPGTRFFPVIVAFFPASVAAVATAVRRPTSLLLAALAAPIGAGLLSVHFHRSRRDAAVLATLGPAWSAAYGLGIWRGAVLALRAQWRRRMIVDGGHPAS